MASIFTFDPDPPRVASPWSTPPGRSTPDQSTRNASNDPEPDNESAPGALRSARQTSTATNLSERRLGKLNAEPQEGPTEYKLHLLLRPRRSFRSTTTGSSISGSSRPPAIIAADAHRKPSAPRLLGTPPLASSSQSRQHRLEQLTTQLLWRLQQSAPYHASGPAATGNNVALPASPQVGGGVGISQYAGRIVPGLEESKGALYEIGVADDGTFVGLAQDELDESLQNLRAMASTLGCSVELLRKVPVGECEWLEDVVPSADAPSQILRKGTLWVAEAFVKPNLSGTVSDRSLRPPAARLIQHGQVEMSHSAATPSFGRSSTEQLRLTLTGATMSGKSSLLGGLSSATLDNGRGKSRLSLLKHPHEISSGMTSSVTQELLGYCKARPSDEGSLASIRIVNHASGDVSSWHDIHALCDGRRLVFMSDSAGHPRYHRTTVRGLVGWAPHWTLLCIPADNAEDTSGRSGSTPPLKDLFGSATADVDLSEAYLQICLDLGLSLGIAITKLDLASKHGLRQLLAKLLTTLKSAGRRPVIVPDTPGPALDADALLIQAEDVLTVQKALTPAVSGEVVVPIVLTSAVNGTGISKLHAVLHQLPMPPPPLRSPAIYPSLNIPPEPLFHIEDVYGDKLGAGDEELLIVVSGHLRYGEIQIGDNLVIGPYPTDRYSVAKSSPSLPSRDALPPSHPSEAKSLGGLAASERPLIADSEEWRAVKVCSLRNLRLPVHALQADQVGTIGIQGVNSRISSPALIRVRKGMVLTRGAPLASRSVEAQFTGLGIRTLTVGSMVVVYIASIRATAKIIYMAVGDESAETHDADHDDLQFDFGSSDDGLEAELRTPVNPNANTIVRFRFMASREFVEPGGQILILPGGGPGLSGGNARGEKGVAGLDGFVGKVVHGLSE